MKLWYFTANPLQQSRGGKIGSPGGEKVPMIKLAIAFLNMALAIFMNSPGL